MKKIVLCTGGFDPVHSGHLAYLRSAKELGDILIAGVNSDYWLTRKKGRSFMPFSERAEIIRSLAMVDLAIGFDDNDNSAKDAILRVRHLYPNDLIIFANGGDRTDKNIPEMDIQDSNLEFQFGVGGNNKANSSSWILEEWKAPKTPRIWGYYRVVHEAPGIKVKELTVQPGDTLSMQRHHCRSEFWLVAAGEATVYSIDQDGNELRQGCFKQHEYLHIPRNAWHRLVNEDPNPLKLVEIQYGTHCDENDIERK